MAIHPRAAIILMSGALAATPAFALPSQASVADAHSFVSTCAGTNYGSGISPGEVIFGGVSNSSQTCGYAVSATAGGSASVTSSFSGAAATPYSNSASASAAVGAIHLSAVNSGSNADYFPAAEAVAGWNDQITITNGPIGQHGIWVFNLHVDGALSADGAYPASSAFALVAFKDHLRLSHYDAPTYAAFLAANPAMAYNDENYYQFDQGESWGIERIDHDRLVTIDQTVSFAVPFIYGTAFSLGIYGQVSAGESSYGAGTDLNSSAADLSHTITWADKGYVVAADGSGPHNTNFTLSSLSGFNYAADAPEPATWAFMLLGFGAVGALTRSNRRALAVAY